MASAPFAYKQAIEWLDSHVNWELAVAKPGDKQFLRNTDERMEKMARLLSLMGDPHTTFPSIHLTGTNGKTSTTRLINALVLAQGLRTGTYTSPHLQSVNERIGDNGEPINNDDLAEVLYAVSLVEPMLNQDGVEGERLSYFEIMTIAALRFFADSPVDVGIIEVGVGGRGDATNIVDGKVSVITNIGIDHINYLGTTRESIADKKADIIKEGGVAVIGEPDVEFMSMWEARNPSKVLLVDRDFGVIDNQLAVGGRLVTIKTPLAVYDDVFLNLHGSFQAKNAAVALTAAEAFFEQPLSDDVVRAAFESVTSPGRVEVVHRQPLVVIDGAHNKTGAEALAATIDEEFSAAIGRILVVGILQGHDPTELLTAVGAQKAKLLVATAPDSPRAIPAEEIASAASALGIQTKVIDGVDKAVQFAIGEAGDEDLVLVTGSLYTVGAARTALSS